MRWLVLVFLVFASTGCADDPTYRCVEAYDHIVGIAKHRPSKEQRIRFVNACRASFDEGRHACLMRSKTVDEVRTCRPTQIKPG